MSKISAASEKVKLRTPGQEWIVCNFIGPNLRQISQRSGFRPLGCFATAEEADEFAQQYRKLDDRFDIYVCKMYEFLVIPDEVHEVGDVKYDDKRINDLLDAHESSRIQTQEWNKRLEDARAGGGDKWGLANL